MNNEQAINLLKNIRKYAVMRNGDVVALDIAIKALEKEPCEDAISRQAVLDTIDRFRDLGKRQLKEMVRGLPSVTPKQRTGHWIRLTNGRMREIYQCSECGRQIEEESIEGLLPIIYPYCHCGAKMEEQA